VEDLAASHPHRTHTKPGTAEIPAHRIGDRYALADAAQAQRDLEGRGTVGKLLFQFDEV